METIAKTLTTDQLLRAMLTIKASIRVAVEAKRENPTIPFNIFNSYRNLNILKTEYKNRFNHGKADTPITR